VEHRMQVRIDEVRESLSIIRQLVPDLPGGALRVEIGETAGRAATALGYVEAGAGKLSLDPHCPRQLSGALQGQRPVAAKLAGVERGDSGQHRARFPGCEQSFNLSYSGTDVEVIYV